jgi:hypothetical protein
MPEEFDNLEVPNAPDEVDQESGEPEAEAEGNRVPVRVVKELRDELRQAREDGLMTRQQLNNLMAEYTRLSKGQANRAEEAAEAVDPEVQKLIQPYLRPFKQELEDLKQSRSVLEDELRAVRAERFIENNVPNLNVLRPHIAKFIQAEYTPEEQAELTPKEVVRIAKLVAAQQGISATTKTVSRSMAKTEAGTTSTRTDASRPAEMSGEKLQAYLREKGFFD